MIKKPNYIKTIESKHEPMSTITVPFEGNKISEFIEGRTFILVWSKGTANFIDGKINYTKKIYKTKQAFYLYLLTEEDKTSIVVYYKQEQLNELTIFISQLLKEFKKCNN